MGKAEVDKPHERKKRRNPIQVYRDARRVAKLDNLINKTRPNVPEDQLSKLRQTMINISQAPEFIRKIWRRRVERHETREKHKKK